MFESFENKPHLENFDNQFDKPKICEREMKDQCTNIVSDFYNKGVDLTYEDIGLQGRYEIANQFYSKIKESMGINAELRFEPMDGGNMGGYNMKDNVISLNSNYLENPDSSDLLDTILHESRHAYQLGAIEKPDSVSVDNETIAEWRDNLEFYIKPEWDHEAYANQPVERDADDFAKGILAAGFDSNEYLTNIV